MTKKRTVLAAALLATAAISTYAWGASLAPVSGPQDPSQINSLVNTLLQEVAGGVNGLVSVYTGAVQSTATTAEQTLASMAIPANTLTTGGQGLKLRCSGLTGADGNTKIVKLYYGTNSVSSGTISTSGLVWDLELLVVYTGASAQNVIGRGQVSATPIVTTVATAATDNLTTALTAKCTATQSASQIGDVTLVNFNAEQIK